MERSGVEVKSGREYETLFPVASGKTIVIKSNDASVEDTLKLIKKTVIETLADTREIAKVLKGTTLEETCSNIWHFVFDHIKYKKDDQGKEQVRRPSRTWANRQDGVDCDCMSAFISSILTNLHIAHKQRIAMYYEDRGWQHIYPIVPKNENLGTTLKNRNDYIVLDCVKYGYNEEEPFVKIKDYDMRLEYLNGPEEEEQMYEIPQSTDIHDLAAASEFEEAELGKLGQWLKKTVRKVGDKAGKGIRTVNKVANPAAILLRNGFLLSMQMNLMHVAARLRYAYFTDGQAKEKGLDMLEFAKLKKIKEKAETIFWQAGGNKDNLKKAILTGKGNKGRFVPMSGLSAAEDEQMYTEMLQGEELGVLPAAAAIAAATAAVSAIAGALNQVKGIFNKKDTAPAIASEDNEEYSSETYAQQKTPEPNQNFNMNNIFRNAVTKVKQIPSGNFSIPTGSNTNSIYSKPSNILLPANSGKEGMFAGTIEWVKTHPVPSLLIAAVIGGGTYILLKKKEPARTRSKGLNGFPKRRKIKKTRRKPGKIKIMRL